MSLKRTADSLNSTNGDVLVSGTEYEMATAGSVVAWPRSDRQVLLQEVRGHIVKYDFNKSGNTGFSMLEIASLALQALSRAFLW